MTDDCNCNAVRVVFLKTSFDFLFFFVYRNTVRYGGMVVWLMVQPYAYLGTQKERIKRLLWWKQHQRGGELVSGKMEGWRRRVFQDELSKATLIELCFERRSG